MTVVVLGLWTLGLVALAWVVVLSRMLTARRESDQRAAEDRWWGRVRWHPDPAMWFAWGDTLPEQRP